MGLQTPKICSRNTVAQGRVCGQLPKVSPGWMSRAQAAQAESYCLLSNSLHRESTRRGWLPGNGLATGNLRVGQGGVSGKHGAERADPARLIQHQIIASAKSTGSCKSQVTERPAAICVRPTDPRDPPKRHCNLCLNQWSAI